MLQALLRGKLSREQENMEDVLTSNVFGFMEYLKADKELLMFLRKAVHNKQSLDQLLPSEVTSVSYEFWPKWSEEDCIPCEPDLVLKIDPKEGQKLIILIEAKYRSGKSSEADEDETSDKPPNDQLAREWDNLLHIAESEKESREPILIYLTADFGYPKESILASQEDYNGKRQPKERKPFKCYWLSWRHLRECFERSEKPAIKDLVKAMNKLNLTFYYGITPIPLRESSSWRFLQQFDWSTCANRRAIKWRFSL
jgi:hypothetical protein